MEPIAVETHNERTVFTIDGIRDKEDVIALWQTLVTACKELSGFGENDYSLCELFKLGWLDLRDAGGYLEFKIKYEFAHRVSKKTIKELSLINERLDLTK